MKKHVVQFIVYEVSPGDPMHRGGWDLGWYWAFSDNDEPHGPYLSRNGARRAGHLELSRC